MERQGILEGLQLFGSTGEGSVVRELPREGRLKACRGSYSSRSSIILSSFCGSGLRELTGDLGGVAFSFDLLSNRRCILLFPQQRLQATVCLEVTWTLSSTIQGLILTGTLCFETLS